MTASALLPTRAFGHLTAVLALLFLFAACDSAGPPAEPVLEPGTAAFRISSTSGTLTGPAFLAHEVAWFSSFQDPEAPPLMLTVLSVVSKTESDTTVVTFLRTSTDEALPTGTAPVGSVDSETASGFPDDGYVGSYVRLGGSSRGEDIGTAFGSATDGELTIEAIRDGYATGSFRFDGREVALATLLAEDAPCFGNGLFEDGEDSVVDGTFSARVVSLSELNRLVGIPTDPASHLTPEYTPW